MSFENPTIESDELRERAEERRRDKDKPERFWSSEEKEKRDKSLERSAEFLDRKAEKEEQGALLERRLRDETEDLSVEKIQELVSKSFLELESAIKNLVELKRGDYDTEDLERAQISVEQLSKRDEILNRILSDKE